MQGALNDIYLNLERIPVERILKRFIGSSNLVFLENNLGNRILYPHNIPQTKSELEFDLILLKESIRLNPGMYYNKNLHKITIPEEFLERFPDIIQLLCALIDSLQSEGITTVLKEVGDLPAKRLGSIIKINFPQETGSANITVNGKKYPIKSGTLSVVKASTLKFDLKFESTSGTIDGKLSLRIEVDGGEIGLIIDARN